MQRGMIIVAKTRHADRAAMALSVSGAHEVAPKLSRLMIKIALVLILAIVAWLEGVAVGHFQWPPFALIQSAYKTVRSSVPTISLSDYQKRAPLLAAFPPKGRIAMIGDSLTELAPWSGMFPHEDIANYGISNDTVEGVLARAPSILESHATKMFVMIGINDLRQGWSIASLVLTYRMLVEALGRDGATVFVQSNLCTADSTLNMRAAELNAEMRMLCGAGTCEFVEVNDAICPLNDTMTIDGLHLSPMGYERWRNAISQYVRAK